MHNQEIFVQHISILSVMDSNMDNMYQKNERFIRKGCRKIIRLMLTEVDIQHGHSTHIDDNVTNFSL